MWDICTVLVVIVYWAWAAAFRRATSPPYQTSGFYLFEVNNSISFVPWSRSTWAAKEEGGVRNADHMSSSDSRQPKKHLLTLVCWAELYFCPSLPSERTWVSGWTNRTRFKVLKKNTEKQHSAWFLGNILHRFAGILLSSVLSCVFFCYAFLRAFTTLLWKDFFTNT